MPKPSKLLKENFTPDSQENRLLDLRTFNLAIPTPNIFDSPNRCYKINNEWAKLLLGFMDWLTETYVWDETSGDVQAAIEQIQEMFVGSACGMDCDGTMDCVEADVDYIALSNIVYQNAANSPETNIEDLQDAYDNTPQSIAPEMPTGIPDTYDANVLCYALENFVSYYAASKASETALANGLQTGLNAILEAAKRIVGTNNLGLLGSFLGDLTYGCAATVDEAIAAYQDDDAAQEVACAMYTLLRCLILNEANFDSVISAIASFSYTNPNAEILACILSNDWTVDMYLVFLFGWQTARDAKDNGATLACNCTGEHFTYDWQFSHGLGEWTVANGSWVSGYVQGEDVGTHFSLIVLLTLPEAVRVESVRIVYERSGYGGFGFFDGHAVILRPTPDSSVGQITLFSGTDNGNQGYDRCHDDVVPPLPPDTTRQIRVDLGADDSSPGAWTRLYRVRVSGTLAIPPFADSHDGPLLCEGCG